MLLDVLKHDGEFDINFQDGCVLGVCLLVGQKSDHRS